MFRCTLSEYLSYILIFNQREPMKNYLSYLSSAICCGLIFVSPVQLVNATTYVAIGHASINANELVYGQPSTYPTEDYKLSHLIWKAENVKMIIAGTDIQFSNGLALNIEVKSNINGGDGTMDDYDWVDTSSANWSHWSHHDDTSITDAKSFNISLDFLSLGSEENKISLFVGNKYETWSWNSRGGSYIYSTDGTTDRAFTGTFTPGKSVITYKQDFLMPYLGLKLLAQSDSWSYKLEYQFSNMVNVSTVDNHVLRDLWVTNNYEIGRMHAYKINVGYRLTNNFNLFIRYDTQVYDEVKGGSTYSGSSTGRCKNCAGADNRVETLSLGASLVY